MVGGNGLENCLSWVLSDLAIDRESDLLNGNWKTTQIDNFDASHFTHIHAIAVNKVGAAALQKVSGLRYDAQLHTALIDRVSGVDYLCLRCTVYFQTDRRLDGRGSAPKALADVVKR